jgi:nucleoid-associated protein YgaU
VGSETKFGLVVGLAFIVLFGVILSGRAGTLPSDHAVLPTGESQGHQNMVLTLNRTVDPFGKDSTIDVKAGETAVAETKAPAEEPLPAPDSLAADKPAPRTEERATVGFDVAMVETPTGPAKFDPRAVKAANPGESAGVQPLEPVKTVYVVRPNDTFTTIARQFYGKDAPKLWKQIYEANKATIKDPNRLAVGAKLVIPAAPAEKPKSGAPDPKADTPKSDPPARDPMREAIRDSAFADGGKSGAPDSAKAKDPAMVAKGKDTPIRDVTAKDLERMFGMQSDLVEQPIRLPATYTVTQGDTFRKIAEKLYGDANKGRILWLRNQHMVPDPSKLKIGQRIILLDGTAMNPDTAVASR